MQAFAPSMRAKKRGTFCFLTSVAGQNRITNRSSLQCGQGGDYQFHAMCRQRLGLPTAFASTPYRQGWSRHHSNRSVWQAWKENSPEIDRLMKNGPNKKSALSLHWAGWQEPEDIAAAIAFLASDRAKTSPDKRSMSMGGNACTRESRSEKTSDENRFAAWCRSFSISRLR